MNEHVVVALAEAADSAAIADIHLSARRAAMPHLRRAFTDAQTRDWFSRVVGIRPHTWWLARVDGVVVGYMLLDGEALDHLYVLPDCQGRGIGTMLLNKAKSLSPHRLALSTFEINTKARAFYEARGFEAVGFTDGQNEEMEPDVQYVWLPTQNG
jgi:ribosomal protein S18 acetylase RimI-like enzyme